MGVSESMDDVSWCDRCVRHMIELDPLLEPELARPIVEDMCTRGRWRAMLPEQAARVLFDFDRKQPRLTA